jgi:hypothetical protein
VPIHRDAKAPTAGGWIWGAGPVFLLPTGTDDLLSTEKWGAGPTAVALRQSGKWTVGFLANHIWSFAGDDERADVNATFMQPFATYTTPTAWSYTFTTESTYDWESEEWGVPLNVSIAKVTRIGSQLVSLGGGVRYWADSTDFGPEGFGGRVFVTLLFPRQRQRGCRMPQADGAAACNLRAPRSIKAAKRGCSRMGSRLLSRCIQSSQPWLTLSIHGSISSTAVSASPSRDIAQARL